MEIQKRLFLGGLNLDILESEITDRFKSFGEISDLVIYSKNEQNKFAYFTIKTTVKQLNKCNFNA
jgi:RNA recognition motif-containing protein